MDQEGEPMIRLATIGTNFITDWLMEGVLELDEIKLTAVYSRNLEKGKKFAAKYGVEKVYDNYEEMAQDPEIDAVVKNQFALTARN